MIQHVTIEKDSILKLLAASLPLISWTVPLYLRALHGDPSVLGDFAAFVALDAWSAYEFWQGTDTSNIALGLLFALNILAFVVLSTKLWTVRTTPDLQEEKSSSVESELFATTMTPMLVPCRTTHTRLFPKQHTFSYSYLLAGVPVGWQGNSGGMLSSGTSRSQAWFHVNPADHLARDGVRVRRYTLREKMDQYLLSQAVDPAEFPFAYLVTAPRFLGYNFNPVSFWYLYSHDRTLQAMILEVNNTFDERRMYLLKATATVSTANDSPEDARTFKKSWDKDFHVSPFNSRAGGYTLAAKDVMPFRTDDATSKSMVSNKITLLSSEKHVKLVARVFSTSSPMDPENATLFDKGRFIALWAWVGFLTFPRIVREAATLFFEKKLQVWYRPEVMKTSIARQPTKDERYLEPIFRSFLAHLVGEAPSPVSVIYRPASGMGIMREEVFSTRNKGDSDEQRIEVDVLSPAFYSRFVHYIDPLEAFCDEFLCTDTRNQTLCMTGFEMMADLLLARVSGDEATPVASPHGSLGSTLEHFRWTLLCKLRCRPATPSYATTQALAPEAVAKAYESGRARNNETASKARLSSLDQFVRLHRVPESRRYRRQVTKLFVAERFTFGLAGVVSAVDLCTKCAVAWAGRRVFLHVVGRRSSTIITSHLAAIGVIHLWSLAKGL